MSEEVDYKTGTITKCKWTNLWANPKGEDVHYHEITLDNGDVYSSGSIEKYPEKLEEGQKINYIIVKNKLKLVQIEHAPQYTSNNKPTAASKKGTKTPVRSYAKQPVDFLGYCSRYAVDMVIAGKTKPADIAHACAITRQLYALHAELLESGATPDT